MRHLADARGLSLILRALPRPVGRVEVEAEEERLRICALDDVDRAVGEEIGRVALTLDAGLSLVQPVHRRRAAGGTALMGEVRHPTTEEAEELVVAALQRTERGWEA